MLTEQAVLSEGPDDAADGIRQEPGARLKTLSSLQIGTRRISRLTSNSAANLALAVFSAAAGATCLIYVYHRANNAQPNYALFWLGLSLLLIPLWLLILSRTVSEQLRLPLLALLGFATYLPAFLRAPTRPVFGDAMAHYLSVEEILRTGNPYSSNAIVPIASYFPGLHTLTASLVTVMGTSSIWTVAVGIVATCHVMSLLGIYSISLALTGNKRPAALAAVIYSISPQFSFFDSQFAYETLAVPLLIWSLALILYSQIKLPSARSNSLMTAIAGVVVGICCVVTHHLTSYILAALLIVIGTIQRLLHDRMDYRNALIGGSLIAILGIIWVEITGAPIVSYLGYFPRTAWESLGPITRDLLGKSTRHLASTQGSFPNSSGTRSLFSGSTLPFYEHYGAFIVQVIALTCFLISVWRLRKSRCGAYYGFALLALTYFILLPLRLNLAGEQGANRTATFQWIGIAIVISIGMYPASNGAGSSHRFGTKSRNIFGTNQRTKRATRLIITMVLLIVSLVGNYGSVVNASFQFPGTFILDSSDGSDTPTEAVHLAQWYLSREGPNTKVVSDTSTERIFETYAFTGAVGNEFPQWAFFDSRLSSSYLEQLAASGGISSIVVDRRIVTGGAAQFSGYPPSNTPAVSNADLRRLISFKWLTPIQSTQNYVIFKVDSK